MGTDAAPEGVPLREIASRKKLSAQLSELTELFSQREVTLGDMMEHLGADASGWFVLLLALPFCAPVTIPGLSTPFGLAIAAMVVCAAFGRPLWLPRRLLQVKLSPPFFKGVTKATARFVRWVEKRVHPRWPWLTRSHACVSLHYWSICLSALLLALPLGGIPFTNTLPGLAVFVAMIGIMERDGVAILGGYALLLGTLIYFATFAAVFVEMMKHVIAWWRG